MPPVIGAAISYAIHGIVLFGVKISLGKILATVAISVASSYLSARLAASKIPSFAADVAGQKVTFRSPIAERILVWGETVVSGPVATGGYNRGGLHVWLLQPLAGHEIESVEQVYLNGTAIDDARYSNPTTYQDTAFTLTGGLFINSGGALNFDGKFHSRQCVKVENALPAEANGYFFIMDSKDQDVTSTFLRVFRTDGLPFVNSTGYTGGGIKLTKQYATYEAELGSDSQAANQFLIDWYDELGYPASWTINHRLRGVAYIVTRLLFNATVHSGGFPNITALVRGRKCYDPRDTTTAWTQNSALCIRDYMTLPRERGGFGIDASKLNEQSFIDAANICDESVAVPGGAQARYTCDIAVNTAENPGDIMQKLLSTCAGHLTYVQGVYSLYVGAHIASSATLTESNRRGPLRVRPNPSRKNLFNTVGGMFVDKSRNYQASEFGTIVDATAKTNDGGVELKTSIELPGTTNKYRAQRLAKLQLAQHRLGMVVEYPANLSALSIKPHDTVLVNEDRMGWVNKEFTVLSWKFSDDLGVDLVLKEEDAGAYAWAEGDAKGYEPPPGTSLPNPADISDPQNLTLSSGEDALLVTSDGTLVPRIYAEWEAPDEGTLAEYEVRWRESSGGGWQARAVGRPGMYISPVTEGVNYDVSVRAVNRIGSLSEWVTVTAHTVIGRTAPPPDVDAFVPQRQPDGTREYSWVYLSPPLDWDGMLIKYKSGTGWSWDDLAPLHTELLTASPWENNQLPAGTYTFGIKAVDKSGIESANAVLQEVTLDDPRIPGTVLTRNLFALGWPGTKVNCFVTSAGNLVPTSQDTWDTLPSTWDAWTGWNLNPAASMTYTTIEIDIGAVVSFIPLVNYISDGGTVLVEERHKTLVGDSWSSWATADGTLLTAGFIQARITITNPGAGGLTGGQLTLSAEPIKETIEALDTSTLTGAYDLGVGDIRLPIAKSYSLIKSVNVTVHSPAAGYTVELVDLDTTTGPNIKIRDAAQALKDATITAVIEGV